LKYDDFNAETIKNRAATLLDNFEARIFKYITIIIDAELINKACVTKYSTGSARKNTRSVSSALASNNYCTFPSSAMVEAVSKRKNINFGGDN